jgi:hypothetical protein
VSNFNKSQWQGLDTYGGSWEITPLISPSREVHAMEGDSSWPALATQVDK